MWVIISRPGEKRIRIYGPFASADLAFQALPVVPGDLPKASIVEVKQLPLEITSPDILRRKLERILQLRQSASKYENLNVFLPRKVRPASMVQKTAKEIVDKPSLDTIMTEYERRARIRQARDAKPIDLIEEE
jgi:hypothetical protein